MLNFHPHTYFIPLGPNMQYVFMKETREKLNIFHLAMICIFLFFLWHHWSVLSNIPLIPGPDGGYYAVQVREILRSGTLYYSAPPVAFYIFALFSWILIAINAYPAPLCIISGIKLGLAFMKALCVFPMYLISKQITKNETLSIIVPVLLEINPFFMLLANGTSLYKNAVGIFFLLFYIYYLNTLIVEKNGRNLLFALFFLSLTALTHILDFGLAIAYTIVYVLIEIIRVKRVDLSNYLIRLFLLEAGILLSLFCIIIVFFPVYSGTYYKFEGFINEVLMGSEQAFRPGVLPRDPNVLLSLSFALFGILATVKKIVLKEYSVNNDSVHMKILLSSSLLILFLTNPNYPPDWRIRFLFVTFVPMIIMLPSVFTHVKNTESVLLIVLLLSSLFIPLYLNCSIARPVISPQETMDLTRMKDLIPRENAIVLARFGLHYWVTWFMDVKADYNFPQLQNYVKQYNHVFVIIEQKLNAPPIPPEWEIIYVGESLILAKVK